MCHVTENYSWSSPASAELGTPGLKAFASFTVRLKAGSIARPIRGWSDILSSLQPPHLPPITHLWGPWGPSGSGRDARRQAVCQALVVAPHVTFQHPPGASGAGPQREPARGAGAEDHGYRDDGYRGRVRGVELALHDLPGLVVFFQFLHAVPQQVHPVASGGGAQHAG